MLGAGHMHQAIPQLKVLHWKSTHKPTLTAELKQDENGFVYVKPLYIAPLKSVNEGIPSVFRAA